MDKPIYWDRFPIGSRYKNWQHSSLKSNASNATIRIEIPPLLKELHHFQTSILAPLRILGTRPCVSNPRRETCYVSSLSAVCYDVWGRGTFPQNNGGWHKFHSTSYCTLLPRDCPSKCTTTSPYYQNIVTYYLALLEPIGTPKPPQGEYILLIYWYCTTPSTRVHCTKLPMVLLLLDLQRNILLFYQVQVQVPRPTEFYRANILLLYQVQYMSTRVYWRSTRRSPSIYDLVNM
jgi:hypothetical protein